MTNTLQAATDSPSVDAACSTIALRAGERILNRILADQFNRHEHTLESIACLVQDAIDLLVSEMSLPRRANVDDACTAYRPDFECLDDGQKLRRRHEAQKWLQAWQTVLRANP